MYVYNLPRMLRVPRYVPKALWHQHHARWQQPPKIVRPTQERDQDLGPGHDTKHRLQESDHRCGSRVIQD